MNAVSFQILLNLSVEIERVAHPITSLVHRIQSFSVENFPRIVVVATIGRTCAYLEMGRETSYTLLNKLSYSIHSLAAWQVG